MLGINKIQAYFGLIEYKVGDKVVKTDWVDDEGDVPHPKTRYGTVHKIEPMTTVTSAHPTTRRVSNPIVWARFDDGSYIGFHARDTSARKTGLLERLVLRSRFPLPAPKPAEVYA